MAPRPAELIKRRRRASGLELILRELSDRPYRDTRYLR
jgi:hypothetical protein